jgi:putative transposase
LIGGCGQILGPAMTGGIKMSFTEEEKKKALQLYDETGSIAMVIHKLGYPSRQNMYTWIKNRNIER